MVKIDLLKDSLNYNVSKNDGTSLGGESIEDLSDLNFEESAGLDIDLSEEESVEESIFFDEEIPSAPVPKPETSGDSLLADLGLDDDEGTQTESFIEEAPTEVETEEIIQEDLAEEPVEDKQDTFAPQQESRPQFDFSSADDDYDQYEEEESDHGPNIKIILIVLFVVVAIAGGSYFLFFSGDFETSGAVKAEERTVIPEQNALEVERQRKLNALSDYWRNLAISNLTLINPIQKLASVTTANTRFSIVRYRDNQLVLTVVSNNRDDLADLNMNMKKNLNIKSMEYLSVTSMKIDNEVKLISDVSIELLPVISAGYTVEAQTHLNQSAADVKTYFAQNGISRIKFDQKKSSKSGTNVNINSCDLSGSGKYSQISGALNNLSAKFPQVKINKIYFYSKNQGSISKSTLTFEMAFDFHKSTL